MEVVITPQDQQWFLSGLYVLETIVDEQEETTEYVKLNFKDISKDD
tara:strand:+ start:365 stop:502 length:138 start_codon:yes stop_codon:yes gene_type:complete